jgi:DNA primase catalytic core
MNDISQFVDEVLSKLQPEQVYEGHFSHEWKKTKSRWRGQCPWHASKSGTSFYVRPNDLAWQCPSCSVGGNPLQYIHQINGGAGSPKGEDFIKIAKQLGAIAGVPFPEIERSPEQQKYIEKVEERRSIIECVHTASIAHLWSGAGKEARDYLVGDRKLTEAQIKDLRLGLYPTPEEILNVVTKNGSDLEKASELGLLYQGSSDIFAPLTGYIVMPWNDERGRLLSLYGRWPGPPPGKQPKTKSLKNPGTEGEQWLKTKASPLFLDRAIAAKHDNVIVVEGIFDAAMLQASGDDRAIAWVAANVSAEQVQTLKRCRIKAVAFCLDPDGAGDKGTLRGISTLTREGIRTFVVPRLPEGQDPDEFVIEHGIEKWKERAHESEHGLRFAGRAIASKYGNDPTDRQLAELLQEAKAYVEELEAPHEVANFFWPEFEKVTGKQAGDAAPDYDQILDLVEEIEESESDESKFDWNLKIFATEKGLKTYGMTGEYLQTQMQARRDRQGELEFSDSRDILDESEERRWIIDGVIPASSTIMLAADGGVGKTTWAYQMAGAIASGYYWSGLPTLEGKVLIVQVDEPSEDTREKLQESGFSHVPRGSVEFLRRWKFTQTRQLFQHMKKTKPNLVVIDSLTAAMAGTGIDLIASNAGDRLYDLRNFAEQADWPCSFLILHHTNGQGGFRDSRSFVNNVSEAMLLTHPKENSNLEKNQFVLDIVKSRAGIQGTYVLRRDDAEFLWIYEGLKDHPADYFSVLKVLRDRPGARLTAASIATELGLTSSSVKSILEQSRKLCVVKSCVKEYTQRESGLPGLLRLYWVEGGAPHPEAIEVQKLEELYKASPDDDGVDNETGNDGPWEDLA